MLSLHRSFVADSTAGGPCHAINPIMAIELGAVNPEVNMWIVGFRIGIGSLGLHHDTDGHSIVDDRRDNGVHDGRILPRVGDLAVFGRPALDPVLRGSPHNLQLSLDGVEV